MHTGFYNHEKKKKRRREIEQKVFVGKYICNLGLFLVCFISFFRFHYYPCKRFLNCIKCNQNYFIQEKKFWTLLNVYFDYFLRTLNLLLFIREFFNLQKKRVFCFSFVENVKFYNKFKVSCGDNKKLIRVKNRIQGTFILN